MSKNNDMPISELFGVNLSSFSRNEVRRLQDWSRKVRIEELKAIPTATYNIGGLKIDVLDPEYVEQRIIELEIERGN